MIPTVLQKCFVRTAWEKKNTAKMTMIFKHLYLDRRVEVGEDANALLVIELVQRKTCTAAASSEDERSTRTFQVQGGETQRR